MTKKLLNLVKDKNVKIPNDQTKPSRINIKKPSPRLIIVKVLKSQDKKQISKAAREKNHITYKKAVI